VVTEVVKGVDAGRVTEDVVNDQMAVGISTLMTRPLSPRCPGRDPHDLRHAQYQNHMANNMTRHVYFLCFLLFPNPCSEFSCCLVLRVTTCLSLLNIEH
jgi:hypothetical protein